MKSQVVLRVCKIICCNNYVIDIVSSILNDVMLITSYFDTINVKYFIMWNC